MAYTLNGIDLGNVTSEQMSITSDLDHFNFPASGTKDAEAFDYGDTKNVITISGTYSANSMQELANWIVKIWALQNGDQDTIIYHSDLLDQSTEGDYTDGNVTVKVRSFRWRYREGRPLMVEYDLELVESI